MSAKINYDYYEGKDIYNDGDIEQVLIDKYKEDINYNPSEYQDLAYFYLLTPIRKNILSWYPFKKDANILEIGAGAGTITGMLCDNAKTVTAVEASKRRAELIYYRHNNRDNLNVMVGNLNDLKFDKKFDYIIMVGVLEYGQIFSKGKNPYKSFLQNVSKHLAPGGKLLVAIENKNGLKYWCGASEDHLSLPYIGIRGYEDYKVRTFGRKELENLLTDSGFPYFRFYYPFPDYKLPYSIYTDEYLPPAFSLKDDLVFNHDDHGYYLNPNDVVENVLENKLIGDFANSFLVEASIDEPIEKVVNYAKLNTKRNDNYAVTTRILKDNIVVKSADNEKAINQLNNLFETHKKLEKLKIKCTHIEKENDDLKIEFIPEITVTKAIEIYLKTKEKDKIIQLIDNLFKYLEKKLTISISSSRLNAKIFDFKDLYPKKVKILKLGLIDLNFSNIFVKNNDFVIFDQEWSTDEELVFDYIKYFSIKLLYEQLPQLENLIQQSYWYEKFSITEEMKDRFNKASEEFFFKHMDVFDYKTYRIILDRKYIRLRPEVIATSNEKVSESNDIKTDVSKQIQELELVKSQLHSATEELNAIKNNKVWKFATKIKRVTNKFKHWK